MFVVNGLGNDGFGLPNSVDTMVSVPLSEEGQRSHREVSGARRTPPRQPSYPSVDQASFHLTAEPIRPRKLRASLRPGAGGVRKVVRAKAPRHGAGLCFKDHVEEFLHNKSAIACTIEERDALTQVVHPFLSETPCNVPNQVKVYLVMEYFDRG